MAQSLPFHVIIGLVFVRIVYTQKTGLSLDKPVKGFSYNLTYVYVIM